MQIETTVHKAALLRLGYHLGGGGIADQKIDRAARDTIAEALGSIAGVQLIDGGGFGLTPAIVGQQSVTLQLDTDQVARAIHKIQNGQWPALSDAQLDIIEELTTEASAWLEEAKAVLAFEALPEEMRKRVSNTSIETT